MSGSFGSAQWMYDTRFYPHEIDQSLRFNDDDSAYLSRTPASAGNRKTWTWSGWVKRGELGSNNELFSCYIDEDNFFRFYFFSSSDVIRIRSKISDSTTNLDTTSVFRDASAWYHVVLSVDTTQATATNRVKLYLNGSLQSLSTTISLNADYAINSTSEHDIGEYGNNFLDGYLAEVNFIDGQALDPTDFGEFKSGVWIPKRYSGSYGTNGFYLDFGNSGSLGADSSGNDNDWTANNLAATDQVLDSPTNNFCTINSLDNRNVYPTLSEGNLKTSSTVITSNGFGSLGVSSGKWYFEVVNIAGGDNSDYVGFGNSATPMDAASNYVAYRDSGFKMVDGTSTDISGATWQTSGDIVAVTLNADTGVVQAYVNNVAVGTVDTISDLTSPLLPLVYNRAVSGDSSLVANFGQDSSFAGNKTAQGNTDANGIGDFYYEPPSGYLALCTANLPDPAIDPAQDDVPADYFNTVLYTGDGTSDREITGVGFQPDWLWLKKRNATSDHRLFDAVRGATKALKSNSTDAEFTNNSVDSFDADGWTANGFNASNDTYVAWSWLAGNGTSSNTDGTITSTVSANQKAGFSIVSYTGTGSNATFGHGLSSAPEMVIVKNRSNTGQWAVGSDFLTSWSYGLELDSTDAEQSHSNRFGTQPTSSVVTIDTSGYVNTSGDDYIAYCFHSVEGYSKIGTYQGNGSSNGPFVYTGFRPAFVMWKNASTTSNWQIIDSSRNTYNVSDTLLNPNSSVAETTSSGNIADFTSNGFKVRGTGSVVNGNGNTIIYMAFAEMPFKYSNAR